MTGHRSLPKHIQLSEMLIREIASGRIPDGSRLPTERAMAAEHSVAVGTLRKALADLEKKGMLKRVHGSGNYVQNTPDTNSIYSFFRLELVEGGGLPTATVLSAETLAKPKDAPFFGTNKNAHRIRRLRFLNSTPIAIEEIWLDADYGAHIDASQLLDSLYLFYKENLNLIISRVEDHVSVATVPAWAPPTFGMESGSVAGYIERTGWNQNGNPVEFSRNWFNPKLARYTMRLQ